MRDKLKSVKSVKSVDNKITHCASHQVRPVRLVTRIKIKIMMLCQESHKTH